MGKPKTSIRGYVDLDDEEIEELNNTHNVIKFEPRYEKSKPGKFPKGSKVIYQTTSMPEEREGIIIDCDELVTRVKDVTGDTIHISTAFDYLKKII